MEKSSNQTIIQKTVKSGVTFGSALVHRVEVHRLGHRPWASELGVRDLLHHPVLNPVTRSRFS